MVTLLLGCASVDVRQDPGAPTTPLDSRSLVYDELILEFSDPTSTKLDVTVDKSGDGAREGWKMMLKAPVGCMEAGLLYGFCLAIAPLFPALTASRIQDPDISRSELEAMAARIDVADMQHRFRESLEYQARQAGLPVVQSAAPGARVARLRAEFGDMILEHNGHKNGSIAVRQPYQFVLVYSDGETETRIDGVHSARFDVENWTWERTIELTGVIDRWIYETANRGLRDTVVEWQPKIVLAPITPKPISKRNIIGIRQTRWPFVESTSPRLAWQALEDALDAGVLADISDVTYELEIFQRVQNPVVKVVGLKTPEHVVSVGLRPCAYYYWRPRARFRFRGVMHTTSLNKRRWSESVYVDDDFLIKTPSADCKEPTWQG